MEAIIIVRKTCYSFAYKKKLWEVLLLFIAGANDRNQFLNTLFTLGRQ